jgi:hypothetical protein
MDVPRPRKNQAAAFGKGFTGAGRAVDAKGTGWQPYPMLEGGSAGRVILSQSKLETAVGREGTKRYDHAAVVKYFEWITKR